MSAAACGAGGFTALMSKRYQIEHERLTKMQMAMDLIASGVLPVQAQKRAIRQFDELASKGFSTAAKGSKETAWK